MSGDIEKFSQQSVRERYHPMNIPPQLVPWDHGDVEKTITEDLPRIHLGTRVEKVRVDATTRRYVIYSEGFTLVVITIQDMRSHQSIFSATPPDDLQHGSEFFANAAMEQQKLNQKYDAPIFGGPMTLLNNLVYKHMLLLDQVMRMRVNMGSTFVNMLLVYCDRFLLETDIPEAIKEALDTYFSELETHGKTKTQPQLAKELKISQRSLERYIQEYLRVNKVKRKRKNY